MNTAEQVTQLKKDFDEVEQSGYIKGEGVGRTLGYNYGWNDGLQQGMADGRHAEWDDFWDNFQVPVGGDGAPRTVNPYAFYYWNMRNFKPKYDVRFIPVGTGAGADNVFAYTYMSKNDDGSGGGVAYDLKQLLDDSGVRLITTGVKNVVSMFYASGVARIPSLDFSAASNISNIFAGCSFLETIDEIIVSSTTPAFGNAFHGCSNLKNLTITGELAKSGSNFAPCTALTHDSLMSIINALKTYTSGTYSINLGSTNLAKLTDAEKAIATEKGWTLS